MCRLSCFFCLVAPLFGCSARESPHGKQAEPPAVTADRPLPPQLSAQPGENTTHNEILHLVSELSEIDTEDHGGFSVDKQQRWEATFEKLRKSPQATAENMVQMLSDIDPNSRACAADILGMNRAECAIDALIARLGDEDLVVRSCAALALGKIGHQKAVLPLIEAMNDEDHGVRRQVATALGAIGSSQATSALISAIKDKGDGPSCDVYTPLAVIVMWPEWSGILAGRYVSPASWALTRIGPSAVPALSSALEDTAGENHAYIAWSLTQIAITYDNHEAAEALIAAKDHFDYHVCEFVAEHLKEITAASATHNAKE